MRKRTCASFRGFRASLEGNVATLFALCALPLIGLIGMGVDVSRALSLRSLYSAAADAAAISAATAALNQLESSSNSWSVVQQAGQTAGADIFSGNTNRVQASWGTLAQPVSIALAQNGNTIVASVAWQAAMPTMFGGIFGLTNFSLSGTAQSTLTVPLFTNISVAIDISQSMGLGATSAAQSALSNITGGCAFGCHTYQSGQEGSQSYEVQAHNAGLSLRIDVIKQATQNMVQAAQNSGNSLVSFSLYTFNASMNTLDQSSTNYTQLVADAGNIDLDPTTDTNGFGDTNGSNVMAQMSSNVPASGSGQSATTPVQYLFLMTDGVDDNYAASSSACTPTSAQLTVAFAWNHCTQPFDPAQCAALKQNNVIIGVVYTTYLQMPGTNQWETLVQPFSNQIASNMQACASPGWFYQATQASDIQSAIGTLFARATGAAVLTK